MMKQEFITIFALVLTKFHCVSRHDTACKYWDALLVSMLLWPCTVLILCSPRIMTISEEK